MGLPRLIKRASPADRLQPTKTEGNTSGEIQRYITSARKLDPEIYSGPAMVSANSSAEACRNQ